MTSFISSIYDYNICTYYLLPLVKLNRYSFGPKNFKQCYLNEQGDQLFVRVDYRPEIIRFNPSYLTEKFQDDELFLIFFIGNNWLPDVELFKQGKFTQFSKEAKEMIQFYSGLHYNHLDKNTGAPFTDARLMAIDENYEIRSLLRKKLESELGTTINPTHELISTPASSNYIEYFNTKTEIPQATL